MPEEKPVPLSPTAEELRGLGALFPGFGGGNLLSGCVITPDGVYGTDKALVRYIEKERATSLRD